MDIHQLRSWIFELYEPLENERQYIEYDEHRGNLLIDAPTWSFDYEFLPEMAAEAWKEVTVRQLLTMTSGVRWNEDYSKTAPTVLSTFR